MGSVGVRLPFVRGVFRGLDVELWGEEFMVSDDGMVSATVVSEGAGGHVGVATGLVGCCGRALMGGTSR